RASTVRTEGTALRTAPAPSPARQAPQGAIGPSPLGVRARRPRFAYAATGGVSVSRFVTYMHAWPLFITVVPATFDAGDVEAYIVEVETLYRRGERFASLVDTSALSSLPGAAERRRLADWQNLTKDAIKRYNVFTAIVVRSPVMRSAMTAMNWVFRPPNEQVVVPGFAEGFLRCIDKLRAAGHP